MATKTASNGTTAVTLRNRSELQLARTRDKDLDADRIERIDAFTRMGYTPFEIVREFLSDTTLQPYFAHITRHKDLSYAKQIRAVSAQIRTDQKRLRISRIVEITPDTTQEALHEYILREDRIFGQAWRDHQDAVDDSDKLKALDVARVSARNKALALGVNLGAVTRTIEQTRKARFSGSPEELLSLVNRVGTQLRQTEGAAAGLELEERTVIQEAC